MPPATNYLIIAVGSAFRVGLVGVERINILKDCNSEYNYWPDELVPILGQKPAYNHRRSRTSRREKDGPTLLHAIQGLHDSRIILPRRVDHRPAVELLEQRYDRFQKAQFRLE